MFANYHDISSKLGTPVWFDESGVPRYCEFHPSNLANIYATEAVLFLVGCQVCGKGFTVAMSGAFPATSDRIRNNTLDYGDPPNVGCGNVLMSSVPQSIIQYWSRAQMRDWRQDHGLEVKIRLLWMDKDDDGLVQRSPSPVNSECAPPYDLTQP